MPSGLYPWPMPARSESWDDVTDLQRYAWWRIVAGMTRFEASAVDTGAPKGASRRQGRCPESCADGCRNAPDTLAAQVVRILTKGGFKAPIISAHRTRYRLRTRSSGSKSGANRIRSQSLSLRELTDGADTGDSCASRSPRQDAVVYPLASLRFRPDPSCLTRRQSKECGLTEKETAAAVSVQGRPAASISARRYYRKYGAIILASPPTTMETHISGASKIEKMQQYRDMGPGSRGLQAVPLILWI